jgi:hypothetical protein
MVSVFLFPFARKKRKENGGKGKFWILKSAGKREEEHLENEI